MLSISIFQRLSFFLLLTTSILFGQGSNLSKPDDLGSPKLRSQVSWHWSASTASPGSEILLAIEIRHPEGWHSYFINPGGPALPIRIEWELPEGWSAGEIQWPTPSVKESYFGKNFIYEGSPIFVIPLRVSQTATLGSEAIVVAKANWQICKEGCITEKASFESKIQIAAQTVVDDSAKAVFDRAESSRPRSLPSDARVEVLRTAGSEKLTLRVIGLDDSSWKLLDVVPSVPFVHSASGGGKIFRTLEGWEIALPLVKKNALGKEVLVGDSVSGVLLGSPAYALGSVKIQESASVVASSPTKNQGWFHWFPVFGGMFLGGLILNLMPCVFPVIGLKVMGFVQQSGGNPRKVLLHGWIFALGVWLSFAVLAGGLWLLRGEGGGQAPAWGYQLQDARIVYALMLLMWLLALNMTGLFEVGVSATSVGGTLQQQHGVMGTFFSGVLATVVATPCSAPYLGSAMAVAVTLPALGYFLAFGAMATGLALPYLVLSAFPKWLESLPRPGPWMERFKQGMSFLLFATSGYLLWVYASQIGLDALLAPLFGLVLVSFGCWIYGNWCLPHLGRRTRTTALVLSLAVALGGVWLGFPRSEKSTAQDLETEIQWREWTQAAMDHELAAGRPVYVDFTARWCATCQINKQRAYPADVVRMMHEKGVVAFRADKTRPNPEIDAALERLGRVAIPVNTLQAPGQPALVLPELLNSSDVADALRALPTPAPKVISNPDES